MNTLSHQDVANATDIINELYPLMSLDDQLLMGLRAD